jgi:hypothetical protein
MLLAPSHRADLHAVRVAAFIRRTLQTDVDMIQGRYGEFQVLVDGATVLGGALAALGVVPSRRRSSIASGRISTRDRRQTPISSAE